ncbi:MAG TPA: FAD-dependent oxidoreductase [Acidimicrobiales bacterium]|nr:FAD-dependent oxidoreductase [Acidimicrobiales bacterium]
MGDHPVESSPHGAPTRPVILVVDGDAATIGRARAELARYDGSYDVRALTDPTAAVTHLAELEAAAVPVALVLVGLPGTRAPSEVLRAATASHPASKRAYLVEFGAWGDAHLAAEIRRGIACGEADYYVLTPWRPGDEPFHRAVSEFLYEHARSNPTAEPRHFVVVADRWSALGHELRQVLGRNGIPHVHYEPGSPRALELLDGRHAGGGEVLVVTPRGDLLVDPGATDLARQYGVSTDLPDRRRFDLVVIGAGPGGLAAAISAASEGLSVLVVERSGIGGQAASSSRIRNYPGFAHGITGAELTQRAYQQAWAFGVEFLHMREVTSLLAAGDRYELEINDCPTVSAAAVLLAVGVSYRRLDVPAVEALLDRGVYYGAAVAEARPAADSDVVVVGGGNSAGQAALHLARGVRSVTIVTRKPTLGSTMSQYLRDEIDSVPTLAVRTRSAVVDGGGDGHLEWLVLRDDDQDEQIAADAAFLFLGGQPQTEWLPDLVRRDPAGYVVTGPDAGSPEWMPGPFETSAPGVFAVGDVRAGSVKRVASAVGEGSIVVSHITAHVARVGP